MRGFKVNLGVLFYKEGEKIIAFSPALDISTCGRSFEQAKRRFEELVNIFIAEAKKMGTLEKVLQDLGWKKVTKPEPRMIPPQEIGHLRETVMIPLSV
ncbi:MAG: hypothetical protein ABIJ27_05655 [Candidatus Omnitrophota bacterium]